MLDLIAYYYVKLLQDVDVVCPCRPRLLFQYLPYSQQEPLQMSQLDIAALVEAVCGAAGASGVWGVSAASPCLLCGSHDQSLQCHRLRLGACALVALVLLGDDEFGLHAGSTKLAVAGCLATCAPHNGRVTALHLYLAT